jgi:hypothetical protein
LTPFVSTLNTEANVQVRMTAGTMSNFRAMLHEAPNDGGGTQTYTVTVLKNGTDTTITCTMSEDTQTCSSASTVVFATDDFLSIRVTATSTAGTVNRSRFAWVANFR